MKNRWALFLLFAACAGGGDMMTMDKFDAISIGASSDQVMATAGQPETVRPKSDGTVEYEYVENIFLAGRILESRYYILILKDGVVSSKRIKYGGPPPHQSSYQMQTTQNVSEE